MVAVLCDVLVSENSSFELATKSSDVGVVDIAREDDHKIVAILIGKFDNGGIVVSFPIGAGIIPANFVIDFGNLEAARQALAPIISGRWLIKHGV